jgi:hypothetical protein
MGSCRSILLIHDGLQSLVVGGRGGGQEARRKPRLSTFDAFSGCLKFVFGSGSSEKRQNAKAFIISTIMVFSAHVNTLGP